MTHKIKLSDAESLGTDMGIKGIQNAALAFANEVKAWNHRNVMVEKTKNLEDELKRWTPCPAPSAHELIMNAVDADGNIDYEIEDDTQALKETEFTQKKNRLFQFVSEAEAHERSKVIPPGKERLWRLQEQEVLTKDAKVRQAEVKKRKTISVAKLEEAVIKKRTVGDKKLIKAQDERRAALQKIERWAAEQHSDIEDLTINTIDAWQMVPFLI